MYNMFIVNFLVISDVEKVLYSQTFGGLVFAFFGGTPHIVLLTTAPLALYTKSMYILSPLPPTLNSRTPTRKK